MTIDTASIMQRLTELDRAVEVLRRHEAQTAKALERDLERRWIVERGLIVVATLIFDVANHLLASLWAIYPRSYEDSLTQLRQQNLISEELYAQLKGLGGLRNILVHEYLDIEIHQLRGHLHRALTVVPLFIVEISQWLDGHIEHSTLP